MSWGFRSLGSKMKNNPIASFGCGHCHNHLQAIGKYCHNGG
jgi:uncharacterized protein YlaI